jgi:hypothetical protein
MTAEQRENIKKDIERMIPHIARENGVFNDDVESVIIDEFVDEDDFVIIQWPEIQDLMDKEGFDTNASLANDEWCLKKYGSSAYFVNKQWLSKVE